MMLPNLPDRSRVPSVGVPQSRAQRSRGPHYARRWKRVAMLAASATGLAIAGAAMAAAPSAASRPASQAAATRPASLFDPARHMPVSEIRDGMTGYGLTVLSGTEITRFPVEVLSVVRNAYGPDQDVIMIRCTDDYMRHVGPIAGCSGSPIYLYDDAGRERLIGAYAYGFDAAKDPIVGVQPIAGMLTLAAPPPGAASRPAGEGAGPGFSAARSATYSLLDSGVPRLVPAGAATPAPQRQPLTGWRPLAVPLAVRGVGAATIVDRLAPLFRAGGFEPLAAPTTGGVDPTTLAAARIEPGSVMAGAMLTGDLEMTALGTCTEVIDGRAFGFGHPFNGEGATSVPMAAGGVNLVMPTLISSFKMGAAGPIVGAIDNDGAYGVAGQLGAAAQTFPITVHVVDDTPAGRVAPGGGRRTYRFRSAVHRQLSPVLAGGAVQAALVADRPLPVEHTLRYDVSIHFDDDRVLRIANCATSLDEADVARDVAWPVQMMMNNPFANVGVREVIAHAQIDGDVTADKVVSATFDRPAYAPGETARLLVRFERYRGVPFTRVVDLPVPDALPEGDYPVLAGDAASNLAAVAQAEPWRFSVQNVDELFAGLQTIATQSNAGALYVRLAGTSQGVAIGRTPLAKLPPSRRAILQAAGRPDTSALAGSRAIVVPSERAILGSAPAMLRVRKKLP